MKYTLFSAVALLVLVGAAGAADEIPAPEHQGPIAIVGATIHPVSSPAIEKGTIVFQNGKIVSLGAKVTVPKEAEVIDAAGKHVYPSLIDAWSNMGLIEINSVRATRDSVETGEINPNAKAQVAVNPDSEIIPVTRSSGVLLALAAPSSSLIAGQSALLALDGWTWEEMTLKSPVGMHIEWPNMSPVTAWWEEKSAKDQNEQRDRRLKMLTQAFDDARAYQKARSAEGSTQAFDSRWEAMLPVLEGELPLIVAADDLAQIEAAVAFAAKQKAKLIIYGGWDAPHCAELLKKHEVPVIVSAVYQLPRRRWEDYDAAYTLPERLRASGVKFCISGGGRFGASHVRNLPYHAATAAGFGLSREEALKAVTLYPAEILAASERVGTLAAGKDATLFIASGDILETATNVETAFIAGRKIDLNDRHKRLWHKYQERYKSDKPTTQNVAE